jgi:hypothetical protein
MDDGCCDDTRFSSSRGGRTHECDGGDGGGGSLSIGRFDAVAAAGGEEDGDSVNSNDDGEDGLDGCDRKPSSSTDRLKRR